MACIHIILANMEANDKLPLTSDGKGHMQYNKIHNDAIEGAVRLALASVNITQANMTVTVTLN